MGYILIYYFNGVRSIRYQWTSSLPSTAPFQGVVFLCHYVYTDCLRKRIYPQQCLTRHLGTHSLRS